MKGLLFTTTIALLCFACSMEDVESLAGNTGKSGSITRFAINQDYMYVLNLNEVQTYDIKQKEHPKLVHTLPTDYGLETITIYDGTVFLGSTSALYILNTDDPAAPSILSQSDRLTDIGFTGCDPVAVKDNYAYSTIKIIVNVCGTFSASSALVVYDITNKAAPVAVGTYNLDIPNGLGYKDNYLFICDEGSDQLRVFDITNPTMLVETGYAVSITDPYDLIVDGERIIVSSKTDFQIFDISTITQIRKLGQISK